MMAQTPVLPEVERQERLTRMVERDYRLIWRLLRRMGVREQAVDDATQQVFTVAAERLADIDPRSERSFVFGPSANGVAGGCCVERFDLVMKGMTASGAFSKTDTRVSIGSSAW
jgi:hypothetical protein